VKLGQEGFNKRGHAKPAPVTDDHGGTRLALTYSLFTMPVEMPVEPWRTHGAFPNFLD